MNKVIKILLADDHPIVRQGLRQTIENEDGLEIVGETGDGVETLIAARCYRPEIILLDIDFPKMDGFQIMQTLQEEKIDSKIIFLTVHREERFMQKAISQGAKGYVLKDSAIGDIAAAIRVVSQGSSFISPTMTHYLIKPRTVSEKSELDVLTPAELRVLRLVAQYKSTHEIAETLFVSPRTIESHRLNITQKLGLRGSHSLMRYALQHLTEIEQE